ncbi:hypothetical protein SAMN05421759_102308 [Roseivivax lentus]|uniref:Uncharacterized protein n=1 Tax=Roseivivax lentus TaxID=633194 RepID=A0A1N7L276_9RHOB|nr:hypothetical protein [Roseivivax lentus]SIS67959.1 hypothetical protein SAMN05421759_102308 [Roseivivax lentus]
MPKLVESLLIRGYTKNDIGEEEFSVLESCVSWIAFCEQIEDSFDVLAKSFLEFETDLFSLSLEHFFSDISSLDDHENAFSEGRSRISLRVFSVLMAAKSYEERVYRLAKLLPNSKEVLVEFKSIFSNKFDSFFEYRLADALRNFAAHDSMPLSGYSVGYRIESGSTRITEADPKRQRNSLSPYLRAEKITNSKKINKKIIREIEEQGFEKIDLKILVRRYISCMYTAHSEVRRNTESLMEKASVEIEKSHARLETITGRPSDHAYAIRENDQGSALYISRRRCQNTHLKRSRWSQLNNAHYRYISTGIYKSGKTHTKNEKELYIPD